MKKKELNICFDIYGEVKCTNSYNDWCETCTNVKNRIKRDLIVNSDVGLDETLINTKK